MTNGNRLWEDRNSCASPDQKLSHQRDFIGVPIADNLLPGAECHPRRQPGFGLLKDFTCRGEAVGKPVNPKEAIEGAIRGPAF